MYFILTYVTFTLIIWFYEHHIERVKQILNRPREFEANSKLLRQKVKYLGNNVSRNSLNPDQDTIQKVETNQLQSTLIKCENF